MVWTGCQLVQSFGLCKYVSPGPSPGLCSQGQKTGPDQTFKHYVQPRLDTHPFKEIQL